LAIYVGTACFVVAGIGGATWASFRSGKADPPLFLQSAESTYQAPTVDWPDPSAAPSGAGVAYLNEWMALVSPVIATARSQPDLATSQQPSDNANAAVAPQEIVKDVPDESPAEKRSRTKAAASQKRRHEGDAKDDDGDRIQTTGQGSTASERSGEQDRRARRSRRARENEDRRDDEDGDRTVGLRYRRGEPAEVRVVPAEPVERGGGLFGIFDSFHNGW
jgi:hypothetical protein